MADKTIIAQSNQSFWDLAMQEYGTDDAAVLLAAANGSAVTDMPAGGDEITCPVSYSGMTLPVNLEVLTEMKQKDVKPGTAYVEPVPLSMRIVLDPDIVAKYVVLTPAVVHGSWKLEILRSDNAVALNPLLEWSTDNIMSGQTEDGWKVGDAPAGALGIGTIDSGSSIYEVTAASQSDAELMCFRAPLCSTPTDVRPNFDEVPTFKVVDSVGNVARISPVVVMSKKEDPQAIKALLLPKYQFAGGTPVPGGLRFSLHTWVLYVSDGTTPDVDWNFNNIYCLVDGVEKSGSPLMLASISAEDEEALSYTRNFDFVLTPGLHTIRIIAEMFVDAPYAWAFRDVIVEVGNFD